MYFNDYRCRYLVGFFHDRKDFFLEELAEVHSESIDDALARLCSYLPSEVTPICTSLIETYGNSIDRNQI